MKKFITNDLAGDVESLFECETYYGQDGNLYSCEENNDNILAYILPFKKGDDNYSVIDWEIKIPEY